MDCLSVYLGYADFNDFQEKNENEKKRVDHILTLLLIEEKCKKRALRYQSRTSNLCGTFSFHMAKISEKDCMMWVGDHYEKIKCSGGKLEKEYDEETFIGMKQLIELCNEDTFFLANDDPIVWYDKHNEKITFFTKEGIHPTNGKTLKPITPYIINKYVPECE